jgi:hypothetical protein
MTADQSKLEHFFEQFGSRNCRDHSKRHLVPQCYPCGFSAHRGEGELKGKNEVRRIIYVAGLGMLFQGSMLFIALITFLLLQPFLANEPFAIADIVVILRWG